MEEVAVQHDFALGRVHHVQGPVSGSCCEASSGKSRPGESCSHRSGVDFYFASCPYRHGEAVLGYSTCLRVAHRMEEVEKEENDAASLLCQGTSNGIAYRKNLSAEGSHSLCDSWVTWTAGSRQDFGNDESGDESLENENESHDVAYAAPLYAFVSLLCPSSCPFYLSCP